MRRHAPRSASPRSAKGRSSTTWCRSATIAELDGTWWWFRRPAYRRGVVVEDYAVIGGQVGIGDKARIETRAVLGSGCGVLTSKIVRAGQVVWGTPARPLKEYLKLLANLGQLPELRREVAELRKELRNLESKEGR